MHFIYQLFEGLEMRKMLAHVFNFSNGYANPKIIYWKVDGFERFCITKQLQNMSGKFQSNAINDVKQISSDGAVTNNNSDNKSDTP